MQPQDVEIERSLAAVQEQAEAVAELKAASSAPAL
jgi:hypothetical protein